MRRSYAIQLLMDGLLESTNVRFVETLNRILKVAPEKFQFNWRQFLVISERLRSFGNFAQLGMGTEKQFIFMNSRKNSRPRIVFIRLSSIQDLA